jgi:superfamily I DNA and/or RNA helicase
MHAELMSFPSERFYESKLVAHESVSSATLIDLLPAAPQDLRPELPLDVIDSAGAGWFEEVETGGQSRHNPSEAELVQRLVRRWIDSGLPPDRIGVITPYSAQSAALRRLLEAELARGLEVDSVDGFQGREKEAILISLVRSNESGEVGFLGDPRRLNVAITRAKRKLIVLGDSATLSSDPIWRAYFDRAMSGPAYRSCFELET